MDPENYKIDIRVYVNFIHMQEYSSNIHFTYEILRDGFIFYQGSEIYVFKMIGKYFMIYKSINKYIIKYLLIDKNLTISSEGASCILRGYNGMNSLDQYKIDVETKRTSYLLQKRISEYISYYNNNPIIYSVEDNICCICLENVITGVLRPCNHACLCKDCLNNMKKQQCPICTTPIRIYESLGTMV